MAKILNATEARRRPALTTVKLREGPLRALETNPGDVKTLQAGGEHALAWWSYWNRQLFITELLIAASPKYDIIFA